MGFIEGLCVNLTPWPPLHEWKRGDFCMLRSFYFLFNFFLASPLPLHSCRHREGDTAKFLKAHSVESENEFRNVLAIAFHVRTSERPHPALFHVKHVHFISTRPFFPHPSLSPHLLRRSGKLPVVIERAIHLGCIKLFWLNQKLNTEYTRTLAHSLTPTLAFHVDTSTRRHVDTLNCST